MFQVYNCITQDHDLRLVVLAGVICFFCAFTAFSVLGRAAEAVARARFWWIAAAAIATGSGIWATHFVAMLAYRIGMPMGFEIFGTALSIVAAIVISGLGFAVSMRRRGGLPALGGAIVGGGIGVMHYIGMDAMRIAGHNEFNPNFVIASLLLGAVLGGLASVLGFKGFDVRCRLVAALVLTIGICAMHFTGMAATAVTPDPTVPVPEAAIEPATLSIAVASVTLVILFLFLASAILDEHLSSRSAKEAARFRQLTDATFEGILMHVDGVIVDANSAMAKLVGAPLESLVGRTVMSLVTETSAPILRKHVASAIDAACEIELKRADGSLVPVEALTRIFEGQAGTGKATGVLAIRDISERREAEERIRHMAHHDALTGLPNRRMFTDRLHQSLARAKRDGSTVAVLCLDLDRFKHVNDLGGHAAGDELLRQVAQRLSDSVRAEDTVARLGGDEFAVIQVGVTHPDGPGIMADRLVKSISQPFAIMGHQTMIGTSVGISLYPGDGEENDDLVRAADTALYRAKEAGRGTFRFFEANMDLRLQERRKLERDLRQALAEEKLQVHYQPLADCHGGGIVGCEALVRWRHPEHGPISPAQFIPLAEECGLISQLGAWVMRQACTDAAGWPDDKLVAVNLSPAQFRHADLAKEILAVLKETGLAANRLELEVTESLLIDDPDRVFATLTTLKAAGVRISLDDFGTGYSSLSYLQRFPFDKIKIDRSFVSQMEKNKDSMSIIRAVIALGKSLQIKITAEGVETETQLSLLQAERCDQVQGYLLGKPMAKEDLSHILGRPVRPGTATPEKASQADAAE